MASSKSAKVEQARDVNDDGDGNTNGDDEKFAMQQHGGDATFDDGDDESSSDDDSLVLEGTLVRNPDASDSDDDEDDESLSSEEESEKGAKSHGSNEAKAAPKNGKNNKKKKDRKMDNEPEVINVEFQFCDMEEAFFHGMKTLLHRRTVHAPHSSQLADLIVENSAVGTVLTTEYEPPDATDKSQLGGGGSENPNVFGLASVVNVTTNGDSPCIQELKRICLKHCPPEHKVEMETVLSGKTNRPAGFFFQERMVNVPLEICEVLHKQLVLDMDWAAKNAGGTEAERKALDFGAFIRVAPCLRGDGTDRSTIYKYFDDEVFAGRAEFVYTFDAPVSKDEEQESLCCVIVMTKTGHRAAMKDLSKMISGN